MIEGDAKEKYLSAENPIVFWTIYSKKCLNGFSNGEISYGEIPTHGVKFSQFTTHTIW